MQQAGRLEELREMLKDINFLMIVASHCTNQEVLNYWQVARVEGDVELDELIAEEIQIEIKENQNTPEELIDIYDSLAALLDKAGLYRDPLLRLRTLAIKIKESSEGWDEEELLTSQLRLADAYRSLARLCQVKGDFEQAEMLYLRTLNTTERLLGREHASTLSNMNNLATLYVD
jgi:tetratricopeptide (TPR) repeat protein